MPDLGPRWLPSNRHRALVLSAIVAGAVGLGGLATVQAGNEPSAGDDGAEAVRRTLADARETGRALLVFRSLAGASKGRPGVVALDAPGGTAPELASLDCDRIAFDGTAGLCVAPRSGGTENSEARILGPDLRVRRAVPVRGIPNRARVSPDGRWGSVTMFVSGHSYESGGEFSTSTTLIDLQRGMALGDLEDFTASHDGRVVTAEDRNFWGTTFAADGDTFYATLAFDGTTHLVRGSIRDRTMRTLHENVECPSLSPDGRRIAFKERIGTADDPWRLSVLDLDDMRTTPIPGTEGLDDQPEWLDDERILYAAAGEIREAPADASSRPRTFRAAAESPAVVRSRRTPDR